MTVCAVIWLSLPWIIPQSFDPGSFGAFTLPRLLAESRWGLGILPILLGGVGYAIYLKGKSQS
jgi:hypothetical protein